MKSTFYINTVKVTVENGLNRIAVESYFLLITYWNYKTTKYIIYSTISNRTGILLSYYLLTRICILLINRLNKNRSPNNVIYTLWYFPYSFGNVNPLNLGLANRIL